MASQNWDIHWCKISVIYSLDLTNLLYTHFLKWHPEVRRPKRALISQDNLSDSYTKFVCTNINYLISNLYANCIKIIFLMHWVKYVEYIIKINWICFLSHGSCLWLALYIYAFLLDSPLDCGLPISVSFVSKVVSVPNLFHTCQEAERKQKGPVELSNTVKDSCCQTVAL